MEFTKVAFLALVGLAACSAQTLSPHANYLAGKPLTNFYYKAGVGFTQIQNDKTDCQVSAVQKVPQHTVIQTSPSYTVPTQTYCNRIGNQVLCNQTGGQTYGGTVSSTDANANLRARVWAQCMAQKKYRIVNIPACRQGVSLASQGNEKVLRPLSQMTCYIAYPSGGISIGDGTPNAG